MRDTFFRADSVLRAKRFRRWPDSIFKSMPLLLTARTSAIYAQPRSVQISYNRAKFLSALSRNS
jgi:hypothetical protein